MKPTTLLLIFTFFAMPGIVYAESPFSSLQSAKEKTTVLQDLRKFACHRRHYQMKRGKS